MSVGLGIDAGRKKAKQRGPVLVIALLIGLILANVVASQYLAWVFQYHSSLGAPAAGQFYWPWSWLTWSFQFYDSHGPVFDKAYLAVAATIGLLFGSYALLFGMMTRKPKGIEDLHGSARFAEEDEIKATGLLGKKGVYVGGWKDGKGRVRYLRHDGPEHIMAFAPTRSGKGVGLVLPTLLSWPHSAVVYDTKGENWALTSGWRREYAKNRVLKFDPAAADGSSVKFNPLSEVRLGSIHEVADVQNLVTMIVDPDGRGLNDHWAKTGHALLVGASLHLLYKCKTEGRTATLEGVAGLLSDPARPIDAVYKEMLEYPHVDGKPHPTVAASARDMLNKEGPERSGVLSTAMSFLTLYRDPLVAMNTSASEFQIRDLMNFEDPVSLYLVIRPGDKERLKPLIRLILNQIVRTLAEKMEFANGRATAHYEHRLLLMLDEFPSLGRMEIFESSLAFLAGYGIKAYLITQDLAQLTKQYGREESITSNCHVRVAYAPNRMETAEALSKMTGTTTVVKESLTSSGKRFGAVLGHVSKTYHETQRPLLTPDECMRLPAPKKANEGGEDEKITEAGDMLIFAAGHRPVYGKQMLYFTDPTFNARALIEAPRESDRLYSFDRDPLRGPMERAPEVAFKLG